MAWQLHYTSARSAARSGFQFTASSPGLPPGAEAVVSPYLGYRPPPDAPPAPDASELAAFPEALSYDLVGGRPLLVLSRYLGRDYSGRFGNFLAHAVLAEAAELEGMRPIEFWRAPFWADSPATRLSVLEDPLPGDALDPESLCHWLTALDHDPYARLAWLLDASADRIILVGDDVEEIVRWFAVVAYSLPVEAAAALSFTTYTADPVTAPHRLVGTTPDVWASQRTDHPALPLDRPAPPHTPSRYAEAVAARWRAHDLDGLDALAELARLNPDEPDGAAVVAGLCEGIAHDDAAQRLALPLLRHPDLPGWVWERLAVPALGFDLAAAVNRLSPDPAAARAAGDRCAHLVLTAPALRDRLGEFTLEDPAELSVRLSRELAAAADLTALADLTVVAERLAIPVVGELTRRGAQRITLEGADDKAVLSALERVCDSALPALLSGVIEALERGGALLRREVLTGEVCDTLAAHADRVALADAPEVCLHLLRSLAARHGIHGGPTLSLAERLPGNRAARGVLAARDVATGRDPRAAARALEDVDGALAGPTLLAVADALTERSPRFRAALLTALDERIRDMLAHRWIETAGTRARRFELVGVALRAPGTPLDGWARELTRRRLTMLQLETYFRDDQTLRAALRDLRG
ncbi:hypothetical protein [Actinocorallia sp. A-T 12471]|uniref:GAP1-N2 domain-containing protein n=1 Tax=Actinocorallia sp. A-T 12471 TaxID=3089813 RepID=UPI0029CCB2EA|nr:hypothetical protein [Actinocorallia sp. A-T 12471]MDX6739361.1 hypothetical protein [Actinocorallia sp. A-T 12471]